MTTATKFKGRKPEAQPVGHFKGVFYGKQGVGKTWFALQLPTPFYIDAESGASRSQYQDRLSKVGGWYMGREDGAGSFDAVIEQMRMLATEKHTYQTLVIDSVTKLWNSEIAREQERLGDKDAFGASKKPAIKQMRRMLDWITKLNMNVVLIAHEVGEWANTDGGKREEVGRVADCWDKVAYELDLTLQIKSISQGNRVAVVTKSRILGFPDGSRFNLQVNNADTSYTEFASRYGKDAIEAAAKPIVLASAAQVAEIERIVNLLKIDEDEQDKIMTKANAETWADLTTDQADKTIAFFKKKLETPNGDSK